jgi:hypothetical protein
MATTPSPAAASMSSPCHVASTATWKHYYWHNYDNEGGSKACMGFRHAGKPHEDPSLVAGLTAPSICVPRF